jgi:hypothetical protein
MSPATCAGVVFVCYFAFMSFQVPLNSLHLLHVACPLLQMCFQVSSLISNAMASKQQLLLQDKRRFAMKLGEYVKACLDNLTRSATAEGSAPSQEEMQSVVHMIQQWMQAGGQ